MGTRWLARHDRIRWEIHLAIFPKTLGTAMIEDLCFNWTPPTNLKDIFPERETRFRKQAFDFLPNNVGALPLAMFDT